MIHSILSTVSSMRQSLEVRKQGFSIQKVSFQDTTDWFFSQGALKHKTGGFFNIVGVCFHSTYIDQNTCGIFLYQPQSAFNGLLITTIENETYFLVQARIEPGNYGVTQFGPTIQSTPANYLQLHGGQATPYLDYFFTYQSGVNPAFESTQLDLGKRYLLKTKRLTYVTIESAFEPNHHFFWLPASVILQAVSESAMLNTDLRSMLAVMTWKHFMGFNTSSTSYLNNCCKKSLLSSPRTQILGEIISNLLFRYPSYSLCPLDTLKQHNITEMGIYESSLNQGFSIEMYQVYAPGREVKSWRQPLINSQTHGRVVLLCRIRSEKFEVLINIHQEPGLATGSAIFPSFLRYPGENKEDTEVCFNHYLENDNPQWLIKTLESDEGGRFFQDISEFELILVDGEMPINNQKQEKFLWIRISELKYLLQLSNCCSIQLRCATSLLLGFL